MRHTIQDPEDQKYGGLEVDNLKEAMDYFQMEEIVKIKIKDVDNLNQRIEDDYHNTYYNHKNKKYGTRTLKMKNKKWHKLNTLQNKEERDN